MIASTGAPRSSPLRSSSSSSSASFNSQSPDYKPTAPPHGESNLLTNIKKQFDNISTAANKRYRKKHAKSNNNRLNDRMHRHEKKKNDQNDQNIQNKNNFDSSSVDFAIRSLNGENDGSIGDVVYDGSDDNDGGVDESFVVTPLNSSGSPSRSAGESTVKKLFSSTVPLSPHVGSRISDSSLPSPSPTAFESSPSVPVPASASASISASDPPARRMLMDSSAVARSLATHLPPALPSTAAAAAGTTPQTTRSFQSQIASLQNTNDQLQLSISHVRSELSKTKSALARREREAEEAANSLEPAAPPLISQDELVVLRRSLQDAEQSRIAMREKHQLEKDEILEEVNILQEKVRYVMEAEREWGEEREALLVHNETLNRTIRDLQERNSSLEKATEVSAEQTVSFKTELTSLQTDSAEKVETLKKQIDQFKIDNEKLCSIVEDQKRTIAANRRQADDIDDQHKHENSKNRRRIEDLQEDLRTKANELKASINLASSTAATRDSLLDENGRLKSREEHSRKVIQDLSDRIEDLSHTSHSQQLHDARVSADFHSVTLQLEKATDRCRRLVEENTDSSSQIEKLQSRLRVAESEIKQAQTQNSEFTFTISRKDAIIARLESSCANDLQANQKETSNLREELECVKLIREKEAEQFGEVVRYFGDELRRIGAELAEEGGSDNCNDDIANGGGSPVSLFNDDGSRSRRDRDDSYVGNDNEGGIENHAIRDEIGLRRNVSRLLQQQSSLKTKCLSLSSEAHTIYSSARKITKSTSTPFQTPVKMKSNDNSGNHHDHEYYQKKVLDLEREISSLQASLADSKSENSKLKATVSSLRTRENSSDDRVRALEGEILELRATMARKEMQLEGTDIHGYSHDKSDVERKLLEAKVKEMEGKIQLLVKKVEQGNESEKISQEKELTRSLEKVKKREEIEEACKPLKSQIFELQTKLNQLESRPLSTPISPADSEQSAREKELIRRLDEVKKREDIEKACSPLKSQILELQMKLGIAENRSNKPQTPSQPHSSEGEIEVMKIEMQTAKSEAKLAEAKMRLENSENTQRMMERILSAQPRSHQPHQQQQQPPVQQVNQQATQPTTSSTPSSVEQTDVLKSQLEHEREQILNLHNKLTAAAQAQSLEAAAKLQTIISKSREEIKKAKERYRRRWKDVQGELDRERKANREMRKEFDEYRRREMAGDDREMTRDNIDTEENDAGNCKASIENDGALEVEMLQTPKSANLRRSNGHSRSRKIRLVNEKLQSQQDAIRSARQEAREVVLCYQKTNDILRKRLLDKGKRGRVGGVPEIQEDDDDEAVDLSDDDYTLDEVSFDIKDNISVLQHSLTEQDRMIETIQARIS